MRFLPKQRFRDPSVFHNSLFDEYMFLVALCLGQLIANAGLSICVTLMFHLIQEFHASPSSIPWYSASFGQTMGAVSLITGQIGDAFGLKKMILGGYACAIIFSLVTGFSYYDKFQGPDLLIVARAFQGVGIAFVVPNILGTAGRVYSSAKLMRRIAFGLMGACVPIGLFLGQWFSGIISTKTGRWDWCFYAYAIFATVCMIFSWMYVPDMPPINRPDKVRSIDWIGGTIAVTGLTLFCYALNQAPTIGWSNASIIVLISVGFALLVIFPFYEIHLATNPIIPPYLLSHKDLRVPAAMFVVFLGWGAFGVCLVRSTMLCQMFRSWSPFATGSTWTPMVPVGIIAVVVCGFIMNDYTIELILFASALCFLIASITLATATPEQSYWRNMFGAWIAIPIALGWSYPSSTVFMSERLPPESQGLAGSCVQFAMGYGIAIFLGFAGVIQTQIQIQFPNDLFRAYKAAMWFSIGISGLACIISGLFVVTRVIGPYFGIRTGGYDDYNRKSDDVEQRDTNGDSEKSSNGEEQTNKPAARSNNSDSDSVSELSVEQ